MVKQILRLSAPDAHRTITMPDEPLYRAEAQEPAYHLRYTWTGWPSGEQFIDLPPREEVLAQAAPGWESDGLRALESRWTNQIIQIAFSTRFNVTPVHVAARAKGRLQYVLRMNGKPQDFSRKLAVRSIGDNRSEDVEAYIASQVEKERFADPVVADSMREFTVINRDIDLSRPLESARGRYWYNLHVVLVMERRSRVFDLPVLRRIKETCFRVCEKKGYGLAAMSLMPDHLHLALRGNIEHSPQDIALAFQNNTAYALGQRAIWCENFYAGTFSEYDMQAIRRRAAEL
jgi:REP element-mobilizing transposase RayT